ncbi:MAG TPA: 23S rRNA (adenine(2030)-N(6))-methyltransferase RlmJ, partial [Burkholderiales bacterium]|nr:23S rRNA (adenine(2030)-N(6))-methyltransferase RlmJ [Burkholderiales bacterium]
IRKILQLELSVLPERWTVSLRGCGLLVVNPPHGFEVEARALLDWLRPVLAEADQGEPRARPQSSVRVRWLVPE